VKDANEGRAISLHNSNEAGDDELEAVEECGSGSAAEERVAEGEHEEGGGQGEAEPGGKVSGESGAGESNGEADLTAGRAGERVRERDEHDEGAGGEPLAALDETPTESSRGALRVRRSRCSRGGEMWRRLRRREEAGLRAVRGSLGGGATFSVERERAGAEAEDGDESKEHGEVGAGLMQSSPESVVDEERDFGGADGGGDDGEQRDGGERGVEAEQDEGPEDRFDSADEGRGKSWERDSDAREAGDAEGSGEDELLDAFGQEDPANQDAKKKESDGLLLHGWGLRSGMRQHCIELR